MNDVDLHYELTGAAGPPIVLVHGAFVDSTSWRLVAPVLSQAHRVVRYDRRGHSRSAAEGARHGSRLQQETDLIALVEALDLGAVHAVGSSFGGSIALGLAARRPDLVRSVVVHEPPLVGVGGAEPELAERLARVATLTGLVIADLTRGNQARGAIRFIEELALGPGTWFTLPERTRQTMVANAPTFLDVVSDPAWGRVPQRVDSSVPVLLTTGGISPRWLPGIVDALVDGAYAHAARHTFESSGHAPHLTDHEQFAAVVADHIELAGMAISAC